ncbi:hypothetical protein E0L36_16340 [Streptomyces sp. AJS327]|uniref:hypothetical protein n=1 Tax=Streptomyces sp. AJS327 TaxID=2545265 RepID=UPI0015DF0CA3|nr:hypothetical protein [Streptomyces sp. AJS327]MBA0052423.1 hypothetical protein [Streptomyces sp. AJS327]
MTRHRPRTTLRLASLLCAGCALLSTTPTAARAAAPPPGAAPRWTSPAAPPVTGPSGPPGFGEPPPTTQRLPSGPASAEVTLGDPGLRMGAEVRGGCHGMTATLAPRGAPSAAATLSAHAASPCPRPAPSSPHHPANTAPPATRPGGGDAVPPSASVSDPNSRVPPTPETTTPSLTATPDEAAGASPSRRSRPPEPPRLSTEAAREDTKMPFLAQALLLIAPAALAVGILRARSRRPR